MPPFVTQFLSLGIVLVTLAALAFGGVFFIRRQMGEVWRSNYEAEKERADRLEAVVRQLHEERIEERQEQADLRHDLKAQLAALAAKTDLTSVMRAITKHRDRDRELQEQLLAALTSLTETVLKSEERLMTAFAKQTQALDKLLERANGDAP